MNLTESFLTALDSLTTNKMRAVLTMLGVIIGVAAVIALLSIGNGVSASITGEIQAIGSNLITIITDQENSGGYQALSLEDVEMLSDSFFAPAVKQVAAEVKGNQQLLHASQDTRVTVSGVPANYFDVRSLTVETGDGLTENDLDTKARVAILGANVAEDLFPDEYPIGKTVKIKAIQYEVIGVMEIKGGMGMMSQDDQVFIPLTTAQSRLYPARTRGGKRAVNVIYAEAQSEDLMDDATQQVKETLRQSHEIAYQADDDFTVISQTDILDMLDVVMGTITLFLGAIAGISLHMSHPPDVGKRLKLRFSLPGQTYVIEALAERLPQSWREVELLAGSEHGIAESPGTYVLRVSNRLREGLLGMLG